MRKRVIASRSTTLAALALVNLVLLGYFAWMGWGIIEFRAAQNALSHREFPTARKHLSNSLRVWPRDPETLLFAAQAARQDGAMEEASQLLNTAERADAVPEAIALERDLIRLQLGDPSDVDRFITVCEEYPAASQTRLILEAVIIGSISRVDLATARRTIDLWEPGCVSEQDRIQSWIWRGELAIRTGDVDTAASRYRQVVEADPTKDMARLRLAELLSNIAPRDALAHLELLIRKQPNDSPLLFQKAICYRSLGEQEQADQLLAEVLSRNPADFRAILERGQIAMELRQFEAAERWFRKATEIHPERRDPNMSLARCLRLAGKESEAKLYFEKVAKIDADLEQRIKRLREKGTLQE